MGDLKPEMKDCSMKTCDLKDLDRLVSLTCQKSFDSLQRAFAEVVSELMQQRCYRLYLSKNLRNERDNEFHLLCSVPEEINEQTKIIDSHQLHQLSDFVDNDVNEDQANENILLPILSGHKVYGALIVDHNVDFYSDLHSNVILSGITIFSNQMALLQHSSQDALTGLYNRYMLDNAMEHILSATQARREEDSKDNRWCLAMVDIDHFKQVNDTYGHLIGDEVLLQLAQLMKNSFRHDDMLFRFGGEEFSILLKGVTLDQATRTLERFRTKVSDHRFPQVGRVTISLGLTFMSPGKFPSALLGNADKALYYSKEHGRNQLNCFEYLHELELLDDLEVDQNDLEFL